MQGHRYLFPVVMRLNVRTHVVDRALKLPKRCGMAFQSAKQLDEQAF